MRSSPRLLAPETRAIAGSAGRPDAEIPVDDPEYDVLFMTATATARQCNAIFGTEE